MSSLKFRVPRRFIDASIDSLDSVQYAPVISCAKKLTKRQKINKGILLSGPPGVGKTWAIVALIKHAAEVHAKNGMYFDYEFITAPIMFDVLPAAAGVGGEDDPRRGQPWITSLSLVPWLVINDLGKEYRGGLLHDQVVYKLGRILRERCERGLITHITTNLVLKGEGSISGVYGESITSLMSEMMKSYVVNGADRRKGGG